jgi:hypothetical protein
LPYQHFAIFAIELQLEFVTLVAYQAQRLFQSFAALLWTIAQTKLYAMFATHQFGI